METDTAKGDAIVALAVRHLIEGNRTLYVTSRNHDRMQEVMKLVAAAAPRELIRRVHWGRGDECIEATNGNVVIFRTTRGSAGRGLTVDVLLLDEVSDRVVEDALPSVAGSPVGEVHRWTGSW